MDQYDEYGNYIGDEFSDDDQDEVMAVPDVPLANGHADEPLEGLEGLEPDGMDVDGAPAFVCRTLLDADLFVQRVPRTPSSSSAIS
jgi:hypothetical protein